ncbi:MAG: UbiD family decarboxylase [Chloroflexi bacterium]|nr:UbiD family decarboxylase [Chloroflexota bacterium]
MPFDDLREYIARLEEEGEAVRIEDEVNWNLEVGAILRRAHEQRLPAPFFQKIKDYPAGYRMFGAALSTYRRQAIAFDLPADISAPDLQEEYLRRKRQPVKPVLVKGGPCKENIHTGSEVDLLEFPVPLLHDGDGGRFIGTAHLTISRDKDTGWINWGMYRHMLHDRNTVGIVAGPWTHFGMVHQQKHELKNKPMEVAIAIGVDPASSFCAAAAIPRGVSEPDVAGGLRGKPVEMVKCETVDLEVPATSEIVIEGEILPYELKEEGPMGEFTGYMVAHRRPKPVIHVKAVTHRDNPIMSLNCVGIPADDNVVASMSRGAECLEELRARGLPVTGCAVWIDTSNFVIVVAVKSPFPRVADDIAHIIWGSRAGHSTPYIIVVDDDVDPFNMTQVMHALVTKCHPGRGIVKVENTPVIPFAPFLSPQERDIQVGAKVYFDCTWPVEADPKTLPKRVSFAETYPPEVQEKALALWRKYGH